jgi:hypothetical protein
MISPNSNTTTTEIITAQNEGTIASRNMGRDSIARAFARSRVTNK